jgi:hypothetical protein
MSDKYLIAGATPQVPRFEPEPMAQALGRGLVIFLSPVMVELNRFSHVNKQLVKTLVQAVEAIVTFRDQFRGLVLSELGPYLDRLEAGGGGTKRLSRLLHCPKWSASLIEHFLWCKAGEPLEQWQQQGEQGLVLWDGSEWEKPESVASEGLCPVKSSKAHRLTHVKKGYYNPPGKPICVPGLHWISLLVVGLHSSSGPAQVACMRWWSSRGKFASWIRDEELKLLREAMGRWGDRLLHVFDRGWASGVWLGALRAFGTRFVVRWRHEYQLRDEKGNQRAAWKLVRGKRAWDSQPLWDAQHHRWQKASVLAIPVSHPDHPEWSLWLVVARRPGGKPWYLLSSEQVETAEQAWKIVWAYARRWQIELAFKHCKSEFGFQSPRLWTWEERVKLLGLATLAYAFLLLLLSPQAHLLRSWLLEYGCHRTGRHVREAKVPLARLRCALSKLWLAHPPGFTRRAALQL